MSGLTAGLVLGACASQPASVGEHRQLRAALLAQGVTAYQPAPDPDPHQVALGRALFFDPELSGNRDVACATCHLPAYATGDGLALPIGTGGRGLGPARQADPARNRVPRNAPDVLFRGADAWISVFWDGRVWGAPEPGYMSPADAYLPAGLDNILAAQALFPLTSRDEMRGLTGDLDVLGAPNELAEIPDEDFDAIWEGVVARLRRIPDYEPLFSSAFPEVASDGIGIAHVANALAAFEIQAGNHPASPWDRYLAGDDSALSDQARRGALVFYGSAGCSACHSGSLLSDQRYHNLGVPQIGPGKGALQPLDPGRALVTGLPADMFAFRTPPLRNVALTGPWMHNGAYATLEAVIAHHLDPVASLRNYDATQLAPELRGQVWTDESRASGILRARAVLKTLDPLVASPRVLSESDRQALVAFLQALTDPSAADPQNVTPARVPSGLPVPRP
ncbi:MAG: hypothetical protein JNL73_19840 [Anaerolineales bacterium]|nr:hypothetical protein [Anaerolineales bacterium]